MPAIGPHFNQPTRRSRPVAVLSPTATNDSNAAVAVFPVRHLYSRPQPHSGRPGAKEISAPTTGLKVLQTLPVIIEPRRDLLSDREIRCRRHRRRRQVECLLLAAPSSRTRPRRCSRTGPRERRQPACHRPFTAEACSAVLDPLPSFGHANWAPESCRPTCRRHAAMRKLKEGLPAADLLKLKTSPCVAEPPPAAA